MKAFSFYRMLRCAALLPAVFIATLATAQTPADVVMMKNGEFCGGLFYRYGAWSKYWQGEELISNGNVGTLRIHQASAGFVIGLGSRVNFYASLPYIATNPTQGQVQGDRGIQDAGLHVKVKALETELGEGRLLLLASLGAGIPASNYIPEHVFAIGQGCTYGIGRVISGYESDMGMFGRVTGGFHLRGNSQINRISYFTNEHFQSDEVDMPHAWDVQLATGFATENNTIRIEAESQIFKTLGGFDVRYWDAMFPSNERNWVSVGINA